MLPSDLKNFKADAFQFEPVVTAGDVLKFLVLWGLVAIVLDTAGLL